MDSRLPNSDCRLNARRRRRTRRAARPAFSFTEVLFAVMVLGIGFIMIAAMFPVTIRQQQNTLGETISTAVARGALSYLQQNDVIGQIANDKDNDRNQAWRNGQVLSCADRKPDNKVELKDAPVWDALAGNLILPDNPRVAWAPLFRKADNQSGLAQVYIFVLQNRNRPLYNLRIPDPADPTNPLKSVGSDVYRTIDSEYATIEPKPVYATTLTAAQVDSTNPDGPDHIIFVDPAKRPWTGTGGIPDYRDAAGEGAYVILADVGGKGKINGVQVDLHYLNGRIYQLGKLVDPGNYEFELIPGNDLKANGDPIIKQDSGNKPGAKAYIIGKGLRDPTLPFSAANPFEGPVQDVAIYTSYIRLKESQ
jgi:hypothetical protein